MTLWGKNTFSFDINDLMNKGMCLIVKVTINEIGSSKAALNPRRH